ncbi:MAG: (2Fe-2S)-binding protein [Thermomicrobiales bacterium]
MAREDERRIRRHAILGELPDAAPITFTLDGRPVSARAGEPIAAALLAAGVRVFRTAPGSGEPRGGYCMIGRCADCLMTVDGDLSVRACVTPAREGMRVLTQQGHGSWDDVAVASATGEPA